MTEPELIAGLRRKDPSSLDYLYDHYSSALYGIINRIVKREEVAEEVLQDVFLKIWEKLDGYDSSRGRLFTWMLNVARNQAIDKTRSKEMGKGRKTDDIDNLVSKIDRQEQVRPQEDTIGLREVLNKLPEYQRFVVDHLYLKGYTQSELAEESGIPLGTVKTRLRMAMVELRKLLSIH